MGQPSRPTRALHEGPVGSCVISGHELSWTNCTPTSFAEGIDKSTLGAKRPTPCEVRSHTADTSGGTTVPQNVAAAAVYGVAVESHTGAGVCSPAYALGQLRAGRALALQGNAGALVGTPFRSTGGPVNHCVYLNEVRGANADVQALVYDPAADGRHVGWGTAATSPDWWPWATVLKFAAALRPWGDGDPRLLGPGKFYCGIFPDTEPHVHLKYRGVRTSPFPDKTTAYNAVRTRLVNVRDRPSTAGTVVTRLAVGASFVAFQRTTAGESLAGSSTWYGGHDGTTWVHSSGLANVGGAS